MNARLRKTLIFVFCLLLIILGWIGWQAGGIALLLPDSLWC